MAEALNNLKKDYRARFCNGGGKKIDPQQGQNLVKFIQDCFKSGSSDLIINSPNCSTLILKNEERTAVQSQRPKPESASSVKRACKSADPFPTSPQKPVSSRGQSCESDPKPATHDHVAASEEMESPVSKSEKKSTIKDVEALCQCPAVLLGSVDNRESARSPFPVEEMKNSPVVKLHFDNWSMPAAAVTHAAVERLEGPQTRRDEVVPVQGKERFTTSSVQSEKPFSSSVLAAVATRTLGQRYSTSISPLSPCPVKHQDIEIEDECEFLIDESSCASTSWISIPTKNKKSKSDGSATPISKSQPSEKEKTQNKKVKNRKVQVKAHTKQKSDHLDVGTFDFKEMSESDQIPKSEENVLTSQNQKSTSLGKTKKDALRQDSPDQKKNTSWSGLETKPSYEEQCITRMLPNEDLPMPSSEHQEEQTVSLKKSLRSSKNLQLVSKASQDLDKKEQTAKQKLPKVEVAKRGTVSPRKRSKKSVQQSSSKKLQLKRKELSDSDSSEEELEREPLKLDEVCTTSLHQKLETPVIQKLSKSLDKKEQTAEQKLPKVEVAKRGTVSPRKRSKKSVQQSSSKKLQLKRKELSDSDSSEEELEREPLKLDEVCTTSLHQKLETPVIQKLSKSLDKKEQTAEQKLPKVEVAKRGTVSPRKRSKKSVQQSSSKKPQLKRKELSDSDSSEEELEREPLKLDEVCTTSLHQKLETPVIQKLSKSLDKKEQTAEQKLPKVEVAKRGTVSPRKRSKKSVQQSSSKKLQLKRKELSDSDSSEEELEREPLKLDEVCTTSLHQKLETPVIQKLSKSLDKKEQTAEQKLPKVEVAKRGTVSPRKRSKKSVQQSSSKKPQLKRKELSDSDSSEEELEREPLKLDEVCTTSLHQKLETPVIQKLSKSLDKKEQTAEQKLPKVEVAKRGTVSPRKRSKKSVQQSSSKKLQLKRKELSDSDSSEEELEREPLKLDEVCTTSLHQKLETPVIQKLSKSLDKKEQTAEQKLPKVEVAKRGTVSPRKRSKKSVQQSSSKKPQLKRKELSDSDSSEEELEREPLKLDEVCTTSLHQKLETPVIQKLSKSLDKKEQTAEQKLPKVEVAKRGTVSSRKRSKKSVQQSSSKKPQLQREELSDSDSSEEELEREPLKLDEVCTTSLHQKLETPVIQKLTKSKKPRNILHTLESPAGANNRTPLEALQHPMESVKNPEKKWLSAKSSEKIPNKIPRRTNKALYSSSEDTGSQTDTDSSSVQDMARKKHRLPDVKIKSKERKYNRQHEPPVSFVAEKAVSCKSRPVLEDCDKFASSTESPEWDDTSSDNSEDSNYKLRHLLSDEIARHKIVMPSNTPNVRRTKRIRLRPLEYWRGERINYTMDPSGELVISGLVHPETESPRKNKKRKRNHPKQKRDETNIRELPASLKHSIADASKPAIVLDPVTNKEVHLDCINTGSSCAYLLKNDAVEIYKDFNTSLFATGILILKPHKEKGHHYVNMDTITFRIIRGKVIVTIHKTSYCLTAGDCFYVPAGNVYNIHNLLDEESVFLFTQLKDG